jgi:hypothetical protein
MRDHRCEHCGEERRIWRTLCNSENVNLAEVLAVMPETPVTEEMCEAVAFAKSLDCRPNNVVFEAILIARFIKQERPIPPLAHPSLSDSVEVSNGDSLKREQTCRRVERLNFTSTLENTRRHSNKGSG